MVWIVPNFYYCFVQTAAGTMAVTQTVSHYSQASGSYPGSYPAQNPYPTQMAQAPYPAQPNVYTTPANYGMQNAPPPAYNTVTVSNFYGRNLQFLLDIIFVNDMAVVTDSTFVTN